VHNQNRQGGRGVFQNQPKRDPATNQPIPLGGNMWQGMLRWSFYEPSLVKQFTEGFGIETRDRMPDHERNRNQKRWVEFAAQLIEIDPSIKRTARTGRYRAGNHVDSGTLMYERQGVQCAVIRSALRNVDYGWTDMFGEFKPATQGPYPIYTVTATYQLLAPGEKGISVPTEMQQALRSLGSESAWSLYAYDNVDIERWVQNNAPKGMDIMSCPLSDLADALKGKGFDFETLPHNFTLNFTKPKLGGPFREAVRVSKSTLVCVPLDESVQQQGVSAVEEADLWEASPKDLAVA
jgi:hypothetical protein